MQLIIPKGANRIPPCATELGSASNPTPTQSLLRFIIAALSVIPSIGKKLLYYDTIISSVSWNVSSVGLLISFSYVILLADIRIVL